MINQKDCTIIIPHLGKTKEQRYALEQCINSLTSTVPDMKKIVVVNGDTDMFVHHQHASISYIKLDNQGQCKAVNAAVATTNTEWIFITNDDMIYAPGWWEKLTDLSDSIKCVSPQLVEPRPGAPSFIVNFCGGAGGDFNKEKWLDYASLHKGSGLRRGFNFPILIRKDLFDLVGQYDIGYDPWSASSDTDLQCKIELAGVETYQNTDCPVYHFSQTSGTFHPDNGAYWGKNYAYFQEKWGFERPGSPNVWFSKDLIDYEKLIYRPYWKDFYKKTA